MSDGPRNGEVVPVAYVTKYALTQGILIVRDGVIDHYADGAGIFRMMLTVRTNYVPLHFHGDDWHESLESAQAKANKMLAAKLKSLDKQRAKLEKYVPKVVEFKP